MRQNIKSRPDGRKNDSAEDEQDFPEKERGRAFGEKTGRVFFTGWMRRKARRRRPPKETGQILKKNSLMKLGRFAFWGMLGFLFLKGIVSTFRPDTVTEAQALIEDFNRTLEQNKTVNQEVSAFAQNFAREYLTYTARDDSGYRERLKSYMNTGGMEAIELAGGSAKAVYTQAYRMEQYAENQWDVYVLAEVKYTSSGLGTDQEYQTQEQTAQTCLKVPVYVQEEQMIIEDLPLFVSDSTLLQEYARQEYQGTALEEAAAKEVTAAVTSFLKAYYEQDATVIDYYLSQDADRDQFAGLDGRYRFEKLNSLKCSQEPEQQEIICIGELKVADQINGAKIMQRMNLKVLRAEDGRYYIRSIDTRTGHLKRPA